jgi:hypothetical protein
VEFRGDLMGAFVKRLMVTFRLPGRAVRLMQIRAADAAGPHPDEHLAATGHRVGTSATRIAPGLSTMAASTGHLHEHNWRTLPGRVR